MHVLQLPIARWLLDAKHSVAKRQQLHHLDLNSKDIIFEQFSLYKKHQILGAKISHHQFSFGLGEWTDSSSDQEVMKL